MGIDSIQPDSAAIFRFDAPVFKYPANSAEDLRMNLTQLVDSLINLRFVRVVLVQRVVISRLKTVCLLFQNRFPFLVTQVNSNLRIQDRHIRFGQVEIYLCIELLALELERGLSEEPAQVVTKLLVNPDIVSGLFLNSSVNRSTLSAV